ncbi:PTS sugar transporter subunit IIA [Melissococcus plutonius]|uniref:PTS sugar transporter subunit IIA n=1 Tax=Melissococcus plutonius TaxID=33970 RepID=UPI001E43E227|nr:PTS sugar transporter subunit IIA [Melissococcus plutonius]MCV2499039.1 PTS sugar transporter subunit IIA [Melissococcus plutonius]MCV2500237.1 PTS sugar transporter subunit IIA [Melissococcus plutonius]MCV2504175.1 PTS sugar transporter subunit IIA [Melissococcus plutonius]
MNYLERVFILASHGNFAEGIYNSLTLILGEQKNIQQLNAYVDESDITERIQQLLEQNSEKEIIVLTDIFGGSVNNEFSKFLKRPNIHLVAGMNLPLIIELLLLTESNPEKDTADLIRLALANTRQSLCYCNEQVNNKLEEDEF